MAEPPEKLFLPVAKEDNKVSSKTTATDTNQ